MSTELPPLPEPDMGHEAARDDRDWVTSYSAEALHAYARAAVAAELEACAALCDYMSFHDGNADDCAIAIRRRATMETHAPST